MRKVFRISRIHFDPVSFNSTEVIIYGNLGIELDRHEGIFILVTIEMLDLDNMTLEWGECG